MNLKRKYRWISLLSAAFMLASLVACTPSTLEVTATSFPPTPTLTTAIEVMPTSLPTTEAPPTPTAAPPMEPPTFPPPTEAQSPLPAEPQTIEFIAEDGQPLAGTYYPAAVYPAPTIVLMHWAPGDQSDWAAIAPWLQNRSTVTGSGDKPWLNLSWFPPMREGVSYAVFTFTFRGCEGGCKQFQRGGWLLDAKAAMTTVKELPGVNPERLVAIGASIGADGAADACAEGCLGALSLSPGNYLEVSYAETVVAMGALDPAKPAWCLAADGDKTSSDTCRGASGDHYQMIIHPGGEHGMDLIKPGMDPDTLMTILDFLQLTLGP